MLGLAFVIVIAVSRTPTTGSKREKKNCTTFFIAGKMLQQLEGI